MRITISATPGVNSPMLEVLRDGLALRNIPQDEQTPELCLAAVQRNGLALEYAGHKSEEICARALAQNGLALEFVGDAPTPQQIEIALRQNGLALKFLPARSAEQCLLAVQHNGMALRLLTPQEKTPAICRAALRQCGEALPYVPASLRTTEMYVLAVGNSVKAMGMIRPSERSLEVCTAAIDHDPMALAWVPDELRSVELCLRAVEKWSGAQQYVPAAIFSEVLIALAVRRNDPAEATARMQSYYRHEPQAALDVARRHGLDVQVVNPRPASEVRANHPRQRGG
ncbi:MAG TPA: DUF4116 domain-containing protein [Xanthomonadales bacterium]|nr:DUF4116 domain-containing protein [Xanthomonadales bacterium]